MYKRQTLSGAIAGDDLVQVSVNAGSSWTNDDHASGDGTGLSTAITLSDDTTSAIHIRVIDDAGNTGAAASQAYTHDDTAPGTSYASKALSADTGTSSSDFETKTAAQTFTATLSAAIESDDILQISVDAGTNWATVTNDVTGSPDVSLSTSITLGAGTSAIHLIMTDDAGKEGTGENEA